MTVIKPRTRGKQLVQHRTRLDRESHETLYAYAAFIGEDVEYVVGQLIDTVLAKDKDFVKWRAQHPESFVARPRRPARRGRSSSAVIAGRAETSVPPAIRPS